MLAVSQIPYPSGRVFITQTNGQSGDVIQRYNIDQYVLGFRFTN